MPVAETTYGRLEGLDRVGNRAFLGVPFAAPPVGPLRFRAPQPPEPWSDVRPATAFAPSAPQVESQVQGFAAEGPKAEDCLYLNVFTPATFSDRRAAGERPVMFWVHGGGFTHGSASRPVFDGGRLAERGDVVVVTTNYRVGALGFLDMTGYLDDATANAGLLDLVAGLQWVHENIASFGGDPGNVTIFGESAGASAIATLLAMPAARGLFHRAIMESGSGRTSSSEDAHAKATHLLAEVGLEPVDAVGLRGVPAEEIVQAQMRVEAAVGGDQPRRLGPVRDGVTLLSTPQETVAAGEVAGIPLLIGSNRDEMKLWTGMQRNRVPIADEDLSAAVQAAVPGVDREAAQELIEACRNDRLAAGVPCENTDILDYLNGSARFGTPSLRLALAQSRHQPHTYRYLFTWESPAARGALGACHALELAFVFGNLDAPTQTSFAGEGPDAERLSACMMDAWTAFARTGNPAHEGIGEWPPFDESRRATMILDRECGAVDDPLGREFRTVDRYLA